MKLFAAPLQGYTDVVFRHWHSLLFGGVDAYFTPFLRLEKGVPASRALRDINSPLNGNCVCVPQIIFCNAEEFAVLVNELVASGHRHINLNVGCPFPPQVHKGRGAGFIGRCGEMEKIARIMDDFSGVDFSLKMRLGVEKPDEWRPLANLLRAMPLEHITVHPRTARQQYRGELYMDEFAAFCDAAAKPVVFNGEIRSVADYDLLCRDFPNLHGVMLGRGLLNRPSLASEIKSREEWSDEERLSSLIELHNKMFEHYSAHLCGEAQIIARVRTFWDYVELPGRKGKNIAKARNISDYLERVAEIMR